MNADTADNGYDPYNHDPSRRTRPRPAWMLAMEREMWLSAIEAARRFDDMKTYPSSFPGRGTDTITVRRPPRYQSQPSHA